ncbi:MAG: hypothetical protein RJA75_606 [Actinomycetota bacterium]|jgi:hydrogenase/urease accessory protein HupE
MNLCATQSNRRHGARQGLEVLVLVLIAIISTPSLALAHTFLTQPITLSVRDQVVTGTATVDGSQLTQSEGGKERVALIAAQKLISIRVNGDELEITAAWTNPAVGSVDAKNVSIVFVSEPFVGALSRIDMRWNFSSSSKQVLLQTSNTSMLANLDEKDSVSFNNSFWDSAWSYFNQGIGHIVLGLDHLLFLVVLGLGLFKVKIGRKSAFRGVALVGAFTLGHALSFTLAYFGLVSPTASFVEPFIAMSIFFAALGALSKWEWEKYWVIASLIGLVHGLGFASSLAQMGIATSQHAVAIVSFNLGVDLAQTFVVALTALALWVTRRFLGRRTEFMRRYMLVLIAVLALFWTTTRIITG